MTNDDPPKALDEVTAQFTPVATPKPFKPIDDRIRDGEFFSNPQAEGAYYSAWRRTGIKPVIR